MILEYDNWNPDGSLNAQVTIEVPTVPETFDISYANNVETFYNGTLLSANELLEVVNDV